MEPPTTDPARPDPALPDPALPAPTPSDPPLPDADELARVAEPATQRRAPRFGAFIVAGTLTGAVLGLVLAVVVGARNAVRWEGSGLISFLDGQASVRLISALSLAVVGALVGGALAVWADRRSLRVRP